jgi:hypothetical protein
MEYVDNALLLLRKYLRIISTKIMDNLIRNNLNISIYTSINFQIQT